MKYNKSVLIYNRDSVELSLIGVLLEAEDCTVYSTSFGLEAIRILQKNDIDIILSSQELEGMDGQEFKQLAEKIKPGVSIYLLPVTTKEKVGQLEPISNVTVNLKEFVQFIQNHIRTENRLVNESVRFKDFFFAFTDRILQVFEVNDRYFFNNDHLVANLSKKIAYKMGLEEKLVEAIYISSLLRDIGKIGIKNQILEKGKLGQAELTTIKSHPLITVQILKQVKFPWNVDSIIIHHHEHYDGNGYPHGVKARQIPLGSRIISIVDSYVAMTTDRPYRKAMSKEEAIQEINKKAGSQFDPEVVEAFLAVIRKEKTQAIERKRILVLEGEETISALIKLNIKSDEIEVLSANTTPEAIQHLAKENIYAIIADSEILSKEKNYFYNVVRQSRLTGSIPFIIILPNHEYPRQLRDPLVDFIVKPLDIDELAKKIENLSKVELVEPKTSQPGKESKGVIGKLEDFGLADIIQVLNMGLKTARIVLERGGDKGEIYLNRGKIVNVRVLDLTGDEAFFALMGWEDGVFHLFHGQTTDDINVTMDTMTLLLESSKALDERFRSFREKGEIGCIGI